LRIKKGKRSLKKSYPEWEGKIDYLPNGCNDTYLNSIAGEMPKKEQVVLSVGRLGSPDKNYGLFLESLKYMDLPEWKFKIVGPISEEFSARIENEMLENPDVFKNIEFTGPMTDRVKLYQEYSKASVFFLPSRFESFGIAFVEALFFGNVLVGHSRMAAFNDLTDNGKLGEYYNDNDPRSFAAGLKKAVEKSKESGIQNQIEEHARQNFYWSNLARRLSSRIRNE